MRKLFDILVLIVFVLSICLSSIVLYESALGVSNNANRITIVIDAGHGGRDGGSVGTNGTVEKDLNLKYSKMLADKLYEAGFRVVMTRKTDMGLYSPLDKNKKISDMNKRMEIIKKANPNLVVSIHMNSFGDRTVRGYQIFNKIDDEASKNVADIISKNLSIDCNLPMREAKEGDYYILNCSYYKSILIECGYLSNPEEESLLNSFEYMDKFTESLCKSIQFYFGEIVSIKNI